MRLRNLILAGTGILTVCGIALAISLRDYTTQPAVANAHVAPVARPLASASGQTSAPMPTTPVTAEPAPQPASVVPAEASPPRPPATPSDTPASVLQEPQQRRGEDGSDSDD